ncbi:MAG: hypothetical protein IT446_07130 [Phycisphaerales bacterium]|nr:hypothetical protein [Phycisphaerales bacterium]
MNQILHRSLFIFLAVLLAQCLPVPAAGGVSPHANWENLAAAKTATLAPAPNYPDVSDAQDAAQLTDGRLAEKTPLWYDKAAVGWVGVPQSVVTIDLGKDQPIKGVALHTAAGQAGVEWPASIQILVSLDGKKFSRAGDLMEMLSNHPPKQGYAALWLSTDQLQTHGRYVQFICTPVNKGGGAYVFMDEIEIYRGDDAWLNQPLVQNVSLRQWRAQWDKITWQDNTDTITQAERPVLLHLIDGRTETGADRPLQQVSLQQDSITFTLNGEASRPRGMTWTGTLPKPIPADNCRYAVLTFRAQGIRRIYEVRPLVELVGTSAAADGNPVVLLEANLPLNDGQYHTLIKRLPEGFTLNSIKVSVVTEDDAPSLTLQRLELLDEAPRLFSAEISEPAPAKAGFIAADLSQQLNGSLAAWYQQALDNHKIVLDGAQTLAAGTVSVSGVPFVIAKGDHNLALMPQSAESTEQVEFLGHQVERRFLEPESRDDSLSIDVDTQAREMFLLLALSSRPIQFFGGQPHTALHLDDIESFSVELTYDQGDREIAFPYSLADKGSYIPARELGAYAVAVDPGRRLKKITLHNHHFGPNFALAALTFNTTDQAVVPELAAVESPEPTRSNPQPADQPPAIHAQGNRLSISNRWYECGIDLSNGLVIDRYVNRWNPSANVTLGPSSGLRVRIGDAIYTGRCFKAQLLRSTPTQAQIKLVSDRPELPMEITVTITADDSPELSFAVQTINRGDKPLSAELCLPALADVSIGDVARTRLFFPQYRNVDTAERISLRAPYGPEFTQQFMDLYSRPFGVGVMIRTDNKEQQMAHFTLSKDDAGISGGVCFPADYNTLDPGQSRSYIPVSLIAHNGDWRAAFDLQRQWVRSWYKPYKSQDKDYLLNAWEIACYRTSDVLSWLETKTPPFINADRTRWMTDEVFAFDKEHHGHVPELVHFYNWTYNDSKKQNEYGVHATELAYAQVGGLDFFRKGIEDIQRKWGVPVSLYTLIDRFRYSALPDQNLAKELQAQAWASAPDADSSSALRATGQPDGIYFIPFGNPDWYAFVLNDIVKMQHDTGCKMVYIDVFSYWSHLKGYQNISPRHADLMVLKELKDKLPADVALWSEYPPTDVASQWEDGALQYYFLTLNEVFARRYNYADRSHSLYREMPINIGRYILTRYKSIGLPGYIEAGNNPSQVDALFINGEAIQEDTWRLHHSRIREKLNRAYVLKHAYADCFNGDNPLPHVDTAAQGIVANAFAGNNRILWTIYNGRPKTYRGIVIQVPHKAGATYRDAWNDKELTPVIDNGIARISLAIDPQQPGCIVQEWK